MVIGALREQASLSVEVMRSVNYVCLLQENDVCAEQMHLKVCFTQIELVFSFSLFCLEARKKRCCKDISKQLNQVSKGSFFPLKPLKLMSPAEDTCLSLWHGYESAMRDK